MSMQAWIHRAQDLGILSGVSAVEMVRRFIAKGWKKQEPGDMVPPEKTDRFDRLVMRAIAEEMISEPRAEELLGQPIDEFWKQASRKHDNIPLPIYY